MPHKYFTCPDGIRIETGACIAKCRMASRCLTVPTLIKAVNDRDWDGTPHVTSLQSGTLQQWLMIKNDYTIDPVGTAFQQLGTAYHSMLEGIADEMNLPTELHFKREGIIQGTADYLEDNQDGEDTFTLIDYKTWGSYRVAKALGIKWRKGASGKYYDRVFYIDEKSIDNRDAEMQVNKYRIELEREGYIITRMHLQVTVRDGSLQVATSRGVTKEVYIIPIPRMPDELVNMFFVSKARMLLLALESDTMPPICTPEERWGDNKCKKYCDVAEFCPHGQQWHPPQAAMPQNEVSELALNRDRLLEPNG